MSLYTENRGSAYSRPTMMATLNDFNRVESVPMAVLKDKDLDNNFQDNEHRTQSFPNISTNTGREVNHAVYLYASQLYASLKPKIKSERLTDSDTWCANATPPQFPAEHEKYRRHVYDLAFSTLKYQALLEDIMLDSGYYAYYSSPDESHALTMVILQDMQDRRFVKRHKKHDEPFIDYVNEVEDDLLAYKTKLNAALAKNRIKFKAASIEYLLPENVRQFETKTVTLPVYAWVNQIKSDLQTVIDTLKEEGFVQVNSVSNVSSQSFALDPQCKDVLVFHSDLRDELENHQLVKNYYLILQDKTSSFGPHSVKALLNEGDDVIHTHIGSGKITAHMASLMNQEDSTVFAFGVSSPTHKDTLKDGMTEYEVQNVRIVEENFLEVLPNDIRFKNVKVILLTPPCSHSGITDPVDYMLQEGEDASILQDLSKGGVDEDKLDELIALQMEYLKHAMKFSRVQAVVYCTHSINSEENESVVTKVTDHFNAKLTAKQMPYRMTPPTLPVTIDGMDKHRQRYYKVQPSSEMSGCFVAVATREATPDEQLTAADIIARAKAKGLMGAGGGAGSTSSSDQALENGEVAEGGKRKKKQQRSPRSKSVPSIRRVNAKGKHSPPNRIPRTSPTRQQRKQRSKVSLPNTSSEEDYRPVATKTIIRKPRTATVPTSRTPSTTKAASATKITPSTTTTTTTTTTTKPERKVELKLRQFAWQKL